MQNPWNSAVLKDQTNNNPQATYVCSYILMKSVTQAYL